MTNSEILLRGTCKNWFGYESVERDRIGRGEQSRKACSRRLRELQRGREKARKEKEREWRMKNQTIFVKTFIHFSQVALISSVGSNSHSRPLSPTVCGCVCWTGSLPSQLCPCAGAISPSLTFTAKLPTDRPPLHHFVWISVPLSLLAGPLKKKTERKKPKQKYTVFFSFSALPWKAIHPCKILTFSSAVLVSQGFALISRIFEHPAAYRYDSVSQRY